MTMQLLQQTGSGRTSFFSGVCSLSACTASRGVFHKVICSVAVLRHDIPYHEVREAVHMAAGFEHLLRRHCRALHLCMSTR